MLSDFFAALLPQWGNFFTWDKRTKQHVLAGSHDELIELLEAAADEPDTYYATAAFGAVLSPTTGQIGRLQSNVIGRRCFHIDFDCGEAKHAKNPDGTYPTKRDAIKDIGRFQNATTIVFSHLVDSGTGIHAYIALSEDITEPEWKATAKKLQALLKQHGLKADDACTTDSARILRAPGSLHGCGARVKLLKGSSLAVDHAEFAAKLVSLLDVEHMPAAPKRKASSINDDVIGSVEGPPRSVRNIVPKCGAMAAVVRAKGKVQEPFWRAMIGLVKYTVEGAEAAHALSKGHPEYDYAATQEKYDRWATPPTTCDEFAKHCNACGSCQYRGHIKSPIVHGVMTVQQVETLPEEKKPEALKEPAPTGDAWDGRIPAGFKVKTVGGLLALVWAMPVENEDEDGDKVTAYVDVPFTNDIFWFSQWADAEHSDDGAQVIMCKWSGKESKTYTMPQLLLENQQKLREELASKSIFTTTHKQARRAMEEYTKAQIQRIRTIGQKPKINTRFGLRITNSGELIAAQGEYVIFGNGEIRESILGNELKGMAPNFTLPIPVSPDGMWGPEVWTNHITPAAKQHAAFMKKHFAKPGLEKLQLAAMVSMASPFMPFVTGEYHRGMALPATGFSVSLYSRKGGRGKTTLMRAAVLAYGNPTQMSRDQNNLGSTEKARIARLTLLGSCPLGMDEMGANTARSVADLVSAIANGSSRERAEVGGGLSMGSTWALTCLIAANKSQREMIAAASSESSAIQYRMLELDVQSIPEFSLADRAEFTKDWAEVTKCAGALGAVIHRRICEMGVAAVNKLVTAGVTKAASLLGDDQTARFQYRALGAVIALQHLLNKEGLVMFPLQGIIDEFKAAQDSTEGFVAENLLPDDELELMSMFLNEQMDSTLVTQNWTRRNAACKVVDTPIGQEPRNVTVRHVVSTRWSYVNSETLRNWCAERHLPLNGIVHKCVEAGVIQPPNSKTKRLKMYFNLYAGTARSAEARIWCYAVNVGKLSTMLGKDETLAEIPESADVIELRRPEQPVVETAPQQQAV